METIYTVQGKKGEFFGIDYYADDRRVRRIIGQKRKAAETELKRAEGLAASGQDAGPHGS